MLTNLLFLQIFFSRGKTSGNNSFLLSLVTKTSSKVLLQPSGEGVGTDLLATMALVQTRLEGSNGNFAQTQTQGAKVAGRTEAF